ncbi:hypothetical protein [Micromonospora sp. b486]|uniref:hypothetical protein n=1 Tax=Micromonospora sp. b486 TaxID=3053986 RepID=UPI00338FAA14
MRPARYGTRCWSTPPSRCPPRARSTATCTTRLRGNLDRAAEAVDSGAAAAALERWLEVARTA